MAKGQINIRLDDLHLALLDTAVKVLKEKGTKTNRTDLIEKAIYSFTREILSDSQVSEIVDRYYRGPF